jgi:hypothetical protein
MPSKREIHPTELARPVLPNLQMIEVINAGAGFRYRLVGMTTVEIYGRDYTGKCPDEMFPPARARYIQHIFETVYQTRHAVFSCDRFKTAQAVNMTANRIYLPLSDDGVNVNYILGVLHFEHDMTAGESDLETSPLPHVEEIEPVAT